MLVIAGLIGCLRRLRGNAAPAAWLLSGTFVGLAGIVVTTGGLTLIDRDTTLWLSLSALAAAVAGFLCMAVARRLGRRINGARARRAWQEAAAAAALVLVVAGFFFVRSPLYWPARWRLPHVRSAASAAPRGPHVLWIMLDTVRADHTGVYGYRRPTTPFLQDWAKSAIVFDNAYGDGIWTVPSQSSMFTGLPARVHGANFHHLWLDDEHVTLAEVLRDAGYATVAFTNNPMVTSETNLAQGFDVCRSMIHMKQLSRFSIEAVLEISGIGPPAPWLRSDFGAALTSRSADQWLEDVLPDGRPVFMYVNLMEAHLPYRVPGEFRSMCMDAQQRLRSYQLRRAAYGDLTGVLCRRYNLEDPGFFAEADRDVVVNLYDAAIRYLDERAAELIRMFDQRGLLEDTLVVISSDHGEYLGEHGMWDHTLQTYNEITRVAILLKEPGRTSGLRVRTPVQPSDLFGTILRATLGAGGTLGHDGARDLLAMAASAERSETPAGAPVPRAPLDHSPSAAGAADRADEPPSSEASRIVVIECFGPDSTMTAQLLASANETIRRRAMGQIAVTDGRFKLIRSAAGREEVYDLTLDPGERRNLAASPLEPASRLRAWLDEWNRRVPPRKPRDPAGTDRSDELQESLRSLGYVGDDP